MKLVDNPITEVLGNFYLRKMPYCSKCGTFAPNEATYCPSCGARIVTATPTYGYGVQNEFDRLTRDSRTQERWIRRTVAYIIDWIVVSVVVGILSLIIIVALGIGSVFSTLNPASFFVPFGTFGFGVFGLSALFFLLYFTFMEATYQTTIGKSLLGLRVARVDGGNIDLAQAFIRNISKIYWVLLLLDLLGGLFAQVKPGQRYTDKIAGTEVIAKR